MLLPAEAQPLLAAFLPHLTQPTYTRFVVLTAAAILTTGRRTVTNLLRTVGDLAPDHDASYRRVPSAAEWSGLELGCALARFLLDHLIPDGPVDLAGGDTVGGHPGPKVYGKGRHRDDVRSSHAFTAWRYGHKWVVPAVLVKFPFAARRWAPPVPVDLYRTPGVSKAEGVRHRTPAQVTGGGPGPPHPAEGDVVRGRDAAGRGGDREPWSEPPRARSGCTRSSPFCTTRSPKRSERGRCRGPERRR